MLYLPPYEAQTQWLINTSEDFPWQSVKETPKLSEINPWTRQRETCACEGLGLSGRQSAEQGTLAQ